MVGNVRNMGLTSLDDLFKSEQERQQDTHERILNIPVGEIYPYARQPYSIKRPTPDLVRLMDSIEQVGVAEPLIVRPRTEGGYEIISGHRRDYCARTVGLESLPVIIREYTDDEADILVVDYNITREDLLPSEKARAYSLKLEAMKRQAGRPSKNSLQVGENFRGKYSVQILSEQVGENVTSIQRYIRLTKLIPPLLEQVDNGVLNDGKSTRAIAEILTEEKVLTPAAYAKEYHPEQYNGNKFTNPYLWAMSTIRNILGRQEYLGHTVLRKSVSTNFKLHKRKSTDEEEQYVFPNTHEPIISQELWDSVQKRRSRVNRASAWGTHSNRLSGYLYCADCGRRMTLQTHYSKKDGSVQYSYRCGGYASRVNSCTSHSISTDNVEALILSSVKRFSRFVLNDEQAFALELQSLWNEKQEEKPKHNQSELQRCQKRYDELSTLVRGLYENLMSGLLPERQYKQLMKQYDDEQAELETKMETMKTELAEEKVSSVDIKHFISLIRKCKNPTEISDTFFTQLFDDRCFLALSCAACLSSLKAISFFITSFSAFIYSFSARSRINSSRSDSFSGLASSFFIWGTPLLGRPFFISTRPLYPFVL